MEGLWNLWTLTPHMLWQQFSRGTAWRTFLALWTSYPWVTKKENSYFISFICTKLWIIMHSSLVECVLWDNKAAQRKVFLLLAEQLLLINGCMLETAFICFVKSVANNYWYFMKIHCRYILHNLLPHPCHGLASHQWLPSLPLLVALKQMLMYSSSWVFPPKILLFKYQYIVLLTLTIVFSPCLPHTYKQQLENISCRRNRDGRGEVKGVIVRLKS